MFHVYFLCKLIIVMIENVGTIVIRAVRWLCTSLYKMEHCLRDFDPPHYSFFIIKQRRQNLLTRRNCVFIEILVYAYPVYTKNNTVCSTSKQHLNKANIFKIHLFKKKNSKTCLLFLIKERRNISKFTWWHSN